MEKLLSLIMAGSLLTSAGSLTANDFGLEPESTAEISLKTQIKSGGAYGDYATAADALEISGSLGYFDTRAEINMKNVADTWDSYVSAGATTIAENAGISVDTARDTVLAYTDLEGEFRLIVTADSEITNNFSEGVTLNWDATSARLFEQDGAAVYDANTNTYTVNMKIKASNTELDSYFADVKNGVDNGVLSVEVANTKVEGDVGTYSISSTFEGSILIDLPGDANDMRVLFGGNDVNYVSLIKKVTSGSTSLSSNTTAKATAAPTVAPTAAPTAEPSIEPTSEPTAEPTEAATAEPQVSVEPQKSGTVSGAKLNYSEDFSYINGYVSDDGVAEIRPDNKITRAEVATIFYRLLTEESKKMFGGNGNAFADVNTDDWYDVAVSTVAAAGIVNGYDDGTFRADRNITRAEFAAIVSRFTRIDAQGESNFTDVFGHWANDEIANATKTGWINGYEDSTFRPEGDITRAEAIVIINRILYRNVKSADEYGDKSDFADNTADKWYYCDILEAVGTGA